MTWSFHIIPVSALALGLSMATWFLAHTIVLRLFWISEKRDALINSTDITEADLIIL